MEPSLPSSDAGAVPDGRGFKSKPGLWRIVRAAHYSVEGLRAAWKHEHAFRQEAVLAAVLIPLALVLPVDPLERMMLAAVVVLVLIVELINSAIEAAIDRGSSRVDALGKRAKDYGGAAVMLALLLAGATWAAILVRHYLR